MLLSLPWLDSLSEFRSYLCLLTQDNNYMVSGSEKKTTHTSKSLLSTVINTVKGLMSRCLCVTQYMDFIVSLNLGTNQSQSS
jgi:hypothetical protein